MGGADTLLDLVLNGLDGDRGLVKGLMRACFRISAGLWSGGADLPATRSSGNGPKVDPPDAELIPDMADTESQDLLLDRTKLCWIC